MSVCKECGLNINHGKCAIMNLIIHSKKNNVDMLTSTHNYNLIMHILKEYILMKHIHIQVYG